MSDVHEDGGVSVEGVTVAAAEAEVADAGLEVPGDVHVITLRGADGFDLDHLAGGCPEPCPVGEAAGRISRAMCETGGRWACDADASGLMLLKRIGDA